MNERVKEIWVDPDDLARLEATNRPVFVRPENFVGLKVPPPAPDVSYALRYRQIGSAVAKPLIRPNAVGAIETRSWRRLIGLPAGAYTIEVTGPDGTVWRHDFEVAAGRSVSVVLE